MFLKTFRLSKTPFFTKYNLFITLSYEQKERSVIGANNYVEYYKSKNPGDNEAKFSINAYEFLSNMMFEEYQQKVKVKKETLGGLI